MKNSHGLSLQRQSISASTLLSTSERRMSSPLRGLLWCCLIGGLALPVLPGAGLSAPRQEQLRVLVLDGEGAIHDTKKRVPGFLSVRVEDATGAPAAGARVEFVAPNRGAGGTFADGVTVIAVTADHTGTADVKGFRPNDVAGSFQVTATAFYQGVEGSAFINQTNIRPGGFKKKWLAVVAGVAGATALAFGRGGGGGSEIVAGSPSGSGTAGSPPSGTGGPSTGAPSGGSGNGGGGPLLPPLPPVLPISSNTGAALPPLTIPLVN